MCTEKHVTLECVYDPAHQCNAQLTDIKSGMHKSQMPCCPAD